MNRRGFLSLLAASPALADPEIWTPSRKIFLPPKGGWGRLTIKSLYFDNYLLDVEKLMRAKRVLMAAEIPDRLFVGVGKEMHEVSIKEINRQIEVRIISAAFLQ